MTTVKLDLISAKAQQAAGKSSKSERADNGLFTEVFSAKLSGSRTTTAADDRSASAAKDNTEALSKGDDNADYENGKSIDTEQNDLQETTNSEDESTEKATVMPAWLLMQLEQDAGNTEAKAVTATGVEAVADPVNVTATSNAPVELQAMIEIQPSVAEEDVGLETIAITEGSQMTDAESVQLVSEAAGDVLIETADPINEAGKKIIESKVLTEPGMAADESLTAELDTQQMQQNIVTEEAAVMDATMISEIETSENSKLENVENRQELATADNARLIIEDASAEEPDAVPNKAADVDMIQGDEALSNRLDNLQSAAEGNRQPGQEKENDNNGSAFAQMVRGEAVRQDSGTVDNTNVQTGMYAAEVEVRDVGQFGRQLIERIDLRQLDQSQQLTIRLRPDEFGSLTIRLTRSPEGLVAQLISDTAVTREMLAQQANDLQQALKDQGFDIVQTEILSDFADQQQDNKGFDSWQQLQEGRELNIRTADAAARLSAQMLEQDESQQRIERYTTGSVDYFA